jgi:ABC-2 type transport system permease protein
MGTAFLLAGKDLKQRLRDRSFLILGIVAPLAITLILTQVVGNAFDGVFDPTYKVYDESGFVGQGLVDVLVDEVGFSNVELVADRATAVDAVVDGRAAAAILIPADFTDPEASSTIEVVGNSGDTLSTSVAASIAESIASEAELGRITATALQAAGVSDPAAYAGLENLPAVIEVATVDAGSRVLDGKTYLAVGMAAFFLFFTVQSSVMNVLEERQEGTLQRLLAAPVGRSSILLGKTLAAAVTGLAAMAVLVTASTLMLGADWGPIWGTVVLSVGGVIAAMGLGALLATVTRTAEQAGQFGGIVATVLGLLGGVFFPITNAGGWLDIVSRISPHRWLLVGFGANAGTGSVMDVLVPAFVVTAFGLVLGGVALARRSRLTGVV